MKVVISIIALMALSNLGIATTQLKVIKDVGGVNAVPFYNAFPDMNRFKKDNINKGEIKELANSQKLKPMPFISSESNLTIGKVSRQDNDTHIKRPFFIVGNDSQSIQWYKRNRNNLAKIYAMGFAVNIKTKVELKQLEQELEINLINSNLQGLTESIGIKHYPVLVTAKGVYQ